MSITVSPTRCWSGQQPRRRGARGSAARHQHSKPLRGRRTRKGRRRRAIRRRCRVVAVDEPLERADRAGSDQARAPAGALRCYRPHHGAPPARAPRRRRAPRTGRSRKLLLGLSEQADRHRQRPSPNAQRDRSRPGCSASAATTWPPARRPSAAARRSRSGTACSSSSSRWTGRRCFIERSFGGVDSRWSGRTAKRDRRRQARRAGRAGRAARKLAGCPGAQGDGAAAFGARPRRSCPGGGTGRRARRGRGDSSSSALSRSRASTSGTPAAGRAHGDRGRADQADHRGRLFDHQDVVQVSDLGPVDHLGAWLPCVQRHDHRPCTA